MTMTECDFPLARKSAAHIKYMKHMRGKYLKHSGKTSRTKHRSKLVFWHIMKAYEIFFQFHLFHVNRKFGSHDMVIYTLHSYECLENKIIINRSNKKVKLNESHSDYLFQINLKLHLFQFFIAIFLK